MTHPRSIAVFCSSSRDVAQAYFAAAADLGTAIANERWQLVYGGNNVGCMGALAAAARTAGGKVIGITPQLFVDNGLGDAQCDEFIVTVGMRERKALLESRADAFIALPGGLGTFEELFEMIVGKTLGYHSKPIILLNIAGFYDPLLALFEQGIEQKFIRPKTRTLYQVCSTVEEAIAHLKSLPR